MPVIIQNEQTEFKLSTARWEQIVQCLLKHLNLGDSEVSIVWVDDAAIGQLNSQWRNKNEPTDVLSFAMGEGEDAQLHSEILGDIVISLQTANSQAIQFNAEGPRLNADNWDFDRELLFLIIHGCLHLLGFDHLEADERAKMEAKEQELFFAMQSSLK